MGRYATYKEQQSASAGRYSQYRTKQPSIVGEMSAAQTPQQKALQSTIGMGLGTTLAAPKKKTVFSEAKSNIQALQRGEFGIGDVVRELPSATVKTAKSVVSGAMEFVKPYKTGLQKAGSAIGEGIAYATDKDVRKAFDAGNLDVLPTVRDVTPERMLFDTANAMAETALLKYVKPLERLSRTARMGRGALEGLGFGITDGIARNKSPEEIVKEMPLYSVFGGAARVAEPVILRALKANIGSITQEVRAGLKEAEKQLPKVTEKAATTAPEVATKKAEIEPSVVQVVNNKTDEKTFRTIKKGELSAFHNKIDDTKKGIAGIKSKDGNIYHLTAKSPDEMIELGFRDGGEAVLEDIPTRSALAGKSSKKAVETPVGVSKVSARLKGFTEGMTKKEIDDMGIATYNKLKDENVLDIAYKYAKKNPDAAIDVIAGKLDAPEGTLSNAVLIALNDLAKKDAKLASKLSSATNEASLIATKMGQEISILRRLDPDNPMTAMAEIAGARRKAVAGRVGGEEGVKGAKKKVVTEAQKELNKRKVKIEEAQKLLDEMTC